MTNNIFNPLFSFFGDFYDDSNVKLEHDRYEVYVNGDYVGNKTLLTQNDDITDVDDFLNQEGFSEFSSELTGDHYNIKTNDTSQDDIKNNLTLYLKIR